MYATYNPMKTDSAIQQRSRNIMDAVREVEMYQGAVVDRRIWRLCDAIAQITDCLLDIDYRLRDLENPQTDEDFR